jgi:putative FmdB family regulatory protein
MPTYTYFCEDCDTIFELFFNIKDYKSSVNCSSCNSKKTTRSYSHDLSTISSSIKKNDSELKTLGDLANRNRDKMSDDQKQHLFDRHNEYKNQDSTKELPKGMSRIKKPNNKIQWRKK